MLVKYNFDQNLFGVPNTFSDETNRNICEGMYNIQTIEAHSLSLTFDTRQIT